MGARFRIRRGQRKDANALAALATQVWLQTYATEGVTPDVAAYVLSEFTPARYLAVLDAPASHLFVAEQGEGLVGIALLASNARCPAGGDWTMELQTLYVQDRFQDRGVGKSLLETAQATAREHSGAGLWLTVNAGNARALAFYERMGYARIGVTDFLLGQARHENHVLVLRS